MPSEPVSAPRARTHVRPASVIVAAVVLALLAAFVAAAAASSERADGLPTFDHHATLLDGTSFTGGGMQHPSVIRASDHFDDPLGEYYVYFGTANEGGIGLAYGDSLDGPLTEYPHNPVLRSVSGPHAIFDDAAGELRLYLHGSTSVAVSTSLDGIDFDTPTPLFNAGAIDGVSRFQLPRVFEHSMPSIDNRYTMLVMGIENGTRKIFLGWSDDGDDWTLQEEAVVSPGPGEGGQIASPHLLEWDGEHHVAYHAASGNIHVARVGEDLDQEEHLGVLYAPIDTAPDRGRAAAPAFVDLDGSLAMLYEAGPSSSSVLAMATSEFRPNLAHLPAFEHQATLVDDAPFAGGGLQHPSIIRVADRLEDPLGDYYLYFGTQNQGGIGLAYADDPSGPFELHGEVAVIDDASGPHAIWDDGTDQLRLYFHRNNSIRAADSDDGIEFGASTALVSNSDLDGVSDLQLPRVFAYELPTEGQRYTMLMMGNQGGTRKVFVASSDDGESWSVRPDPVVSPGEGEGGQVASPHLWRFNDQTYVIYHAASGNIHATWVGDDLDEERHLGVFHAPMDEAPDRGRVAAPAFLTEGDELYLVYEAGPSSTSRIAFASSDGEPRGHEPSEPPPPAVDRPELPEFEHQGIVIDKLQQSFNPTDEFIFPHVIDATEHFDEPLARYYLYYAPHDNPGGIAVQYSDSLDGPWTEYDANPVIPNVWAPHYSVSHVSTPHAFWDEDEQELVLYFHGENSQTRYATSSDGLVFEYGGIALTTADIPGNSEASYARVFEHTMPRVGNRYIMMLMGNQSGTRKIWLAWSDDLRDWTAQTTPLISPNFEEQGQISSPWFFPWDDRYFVVYHSAAGTMHLTEVGEDLDQEHHLGVFYESSTGLRSAAPSFITEGSTMYLFYELGHRLDATIAYATADISEFLDDDTPPQTVATVTPEPNEAGWHRSTVEVHLDSSDGDGSGVERIEYRLEGASDGGGTIDGNRGTVVVDDDGVTTLRYWAVDEAGNAEDEQELEIRIDRVAPSVTCIADPDRLFPPNGRMVDVAVSVDVDGGLSGAAGFELVAVEVGSGDVDADVSGFEVGASSTEGSLRATRDARFGDRIYELHYEGSDVAGNTATCTATVTVARSARP